MTDVKWIKLSTTMFEDEKIRLIESMPDADTLLVIWVKLLAQAGKTNASGYIFLNENIPYTEEMLATIFNRPLQTVRMALQVFQQFGMLEIDEKQFIAISNWSKHQSIEGLDKIREQNRLRKQKQREKEKSLPEPVSRDSHADVPNKEEDKELDIDKEIDKEIKNSPDSHQDHAPSEYILDNSISEQPDKHSKKEAIPYKEIVEYLNGSAGAKYKHTSKATQQFIRARWNEGFRVDAFKRVIDNKVAEWMNTEWEQYLRPSTLFGKNFENYFNQRIVRKGVIRNGAPNQPAARYSGKDELQLPF